jgi:hypothetical protein
MSPTVQFYLSSDKCYSDNLLLALLKARRLRGATGPHACTYRHFDSQLMQPALWQRLPPRLLLAM